MRVGPYPAGPGAREVVQGYLAHKKQPPRRTLQYPYAQGPMVVLEGWVFLVSEVPLQGVWCGANTPRGEEVVRERASLSPFFLWEKDNVSLIPCRAT